MKKQKESKHESIAQSLGVVLRAAECLRCKNMHHPRVWRHAADAPCPVEQQLAAHVEAIRQWLRGLDRRRAAEADLLEALELCLEELDSCDPEFEGTHYCGRCDSAIDRNHEIREKATRAIAKVKGVSDA